jgi:hypothetical protein
MTSTFCAKVGHLSNAPVGLHEVEIGVADSGAIQFDEDVFRAYFLWSVECQWVISTKRTDLRNVDFLDFDVEIWTFVHDDSGLAFLRDIIGFGGAIAVGFRSHVNL